MADVQVPKQWIVIRTRYPDGKGGYFKPRTGKLIAQGAHASMKVFFDLMLPDREKMAQFWKDTNSPEYQSLDIKLTLRGIMADWVLGIFTKVCVRAESEEQLDEIYEKAKNAGLPCALIVDAGKTEFNGVPTKTCCAIGPAYPSQVKDILGHLKLL